MSEIERWRRKREPLPNLPRELSQVLDRVLAEGFLEGTHARVRGQVARTRIHEGEMTAELGMRAVADLSQAQAHYTNQSPHSAYEFQAIKQALAAVVIDELHGLRRGY